MDLTILYRRPRIVIGGNKTQALQVMRVLYTPLIQRGVKYIETNHVSAEIAKLASNMFCLLVLH